MPSVNSIMDDPLAGCLPIFQEEYNCRSMVSSLLLRLRICYSEAVSTSIGDQVIAECKQLPIYQWEYVINEILYEIRRGRANLFNPMWEYYLLNNWGKEMLKKHEQDVVIDVIAAIKKNREGRKR